MKKNLLVTLTVIFGLALNAHAQSEDAVAIKKIVTEFETVFNQKDAKETARFWAEDGNYINYLGVLLQGHDEIEKYFQTTFTRYYEIHQH